MYHSLISESPKTEKYMCGVLFYISWICWFCNQMSKNMLPLPQICCGNSHNFVAWLQQTNKLL